MESDFPDCLAVHLCLDAALEKPIIWFGRFLATKLVEACVTRSWSSLVLHVELIDDVERIDRMLPTPRMVSTALDVLSRSFYSKHTQ